MKTKTGLLTLAALCFAIASFAQGKGIGNKEAGKINQELKLNGVEYGEFFFTVPCGVRGWSFYVKFIPNTNNVIATETDANSQTMEVNESSAKGTFKIDKVNKDFKYVSCTINKDQTYKLKYSTNKKKWILLNPCETVQEVIAD